MAAIRSETTLEMTMVLGTLPRRASSFNTVRPQMSGRAVSISRRSGGCSCTHRRISQPLPTVFMEKYVCSPAHFHTSQRNSSLPSASNTVL